MLFLQNLLQARQAKHAAIAATMEEIKSIIAIYPPDKEELAYILERMNQNITGRIPADEKTVLQTTEDIAKLLNTYPDDIMQRIEKLLGRFYDQSIRSYSNGRQ